MEYISIKNNINQITNIHKNVFVDIINLLPSKISGLKVNGTPDILVVRMGKNVKIEFKFTISKKLDLLTTITNIKRILNETIINLIDLKPYNILMNYQGRH